MYAGGGRLTAFDAATGRTLWTHSSRQILSISGERLLYACSYGTVSAIDRATGAEVWQQRVRPRWMRTPRPFARFGISLPLRRTHLGTPSRAYEHADGILVCAFTQAVVAYHAETGERLWARHHEWSGDAYAIDQAGPVVVRKRNSAVAMDPKTGQMLWHGPDIGVQHLPDRHILVRPATGPPWTLIDPHTGEPTVELRTEGAWPDRLFGEGDGLLYLTVSGDTVAFDAGSGELVWLADSDSDSDSDSGTANGFGAVSDAHATEEAVYVSDREGRVRALSPSSGAVRWTSPPFGDLPEIKYRSSWLGVHGDVVVVATHGGHVAVLDRTTGECRWTWSDPKATPESRWPDVAVDGAHVYVAGAEHLYALPVVPRADRTSGAARPHRHVSEEPPLRRTHHVNTGTPRKLRRATEP